MDKALSLGVIEEASRSIDGQLASMTEETRGECSKLILKFVRDLNDHMANMIWQDLYPDREMGLQKVAKQFLSIRNYGYIGKFDKFLRRFLSHNTPDADGAQRLMIKYYPFLLKHKEEAFKRYGIKILDNINLFLDQIDDQTQDYYDKIADKLFSQNIYNIKDSDKDNYYIYRKKPVYARGKVFYEIVLEPADERPNKFNRITAFTQEDIMDNYCVALSFIDEKIDVFDAIDFPIKIIVSWDVSIRPCEIRNFSRILNFGFKYEREYPEYSALMNLIKNYELNLVEILDLDDFNYNRMKNKVASKTREGISRFFEVLDKVRAISQNNKAGKNILRYLLYRMRNRLIRAQWPYSLESNKYGDFYMKRGCQAFDEKPVSFNPMGHLADIHDVIEAIDTENLDEQFLARRIKNNSQSENRLFTHIDELKNFGDKENIISLVKKYNRELYTGFRPDAEIGVYGDYLYYKQFESQTCEIIKILSNLTEKDSVYKDCFTLDKIDLLRSIKDGISLDDDCKQSVLTNMYSHGRVHCVYGAAGTGKSTLIDFVTLLLKGKNKVFLAKTHPAVENLKQKISHKEKSDKFITIDRFVKNSRILPGAFDIIVVDECSTVTNEDMLKILNKLGDNGILLLTGDIYQIEAIGYGNWFKLVRDFLPERNCHDLTNLYRSDVKDLKELWEEVRHIGDENTVLEDMVKDRYSHVIDESLFCPKAYDEIILCLNYNGLYGLNNINSLLQLNNHNMRNTVGIWQYKIGDKILFNDSERFTALYNNLKGRILGMEDKGSFVRFEIEVEKELTQEEVSAESRLELVSVSNGRSVVKFNVLRSKPYYSDNENDDAELKMPFQVAYAVSIHKSQGLEYDSVKIVIADENEDKITHDIFYTAITRAKKYLTIYWSKEVCNKILERIRPTKNNDDYNIIKAKNSLLSFKEKKNNKQ